MGQNLSNLINSHPTPLSNITNDEPRQDDEKGGGVLTRTSSQFEHSPTETLYFEKNLFTKNHHHHRSASTQSSLCYEKDLKNYQNYQYSHCTICTWEETFSEIELDHFDGNDWNNLKNSNLFWVHLNQPIKKELDSLNKLLDLKVKPLEELLDGSQETWLEFPNFTYISFRTLQFNPDDSIINRERDQFQVIKLFLFSRGIITISKYPLPRKDAVISRLLKLGVPKNLYPGWIVYAILDDTVDCLYPLLKLYQLASENYENLLLDPDVIMTHSNISEISKKLISLKWQISIIIKCISQKGDIYRFLLRKMLFSKDVLLKIRLYFGDIQEHLSFLEQSFQYLEENLWRIHSSYLDFLSVKYIKDNQKGFNAMIKLTYISAAISFLLLISVTIGMNTNIPNSSKDPSGFHTTFIKILSLAIIVVVIIIIACRRYIMKKLRG